jgi:hypothetical protein
MSLDAEAGSTGGSLLTAGVVPVDAAAQGGTPAGANGAPPVNGSAPAPDAPPEWVIPKYWNPDKAKDPNYLQEYAATVSKSYRHAESLLGGERVVKPLSDDDEEGWARWYAASGRPETPDAYEIERPAALPIEYDEEGEKAFRTWAHQNGLNKRQARNLYDSYVKTQVERHGEYQKLQTETQRAAQDALQRRYGAKYPAKVELAKAALGKFAEQDFLDHIDANGLGNDPRFINTWIKIGEELQGETRIQGRAPQAPNKADVQRQIAEFDAKNFKILMDTNHPARKTLLAERDRLYQMAHAE